MKLNEIYNIIEEGERHYQEEVNKEFEARDKGLHSVNNAKAAEAAKQGKFGVRSSKDAINLEGGQVIGHYETWRNPGETKQRFGMYVRGANGKPELKEIDPQKNPKEYDNARHYLLKIMKRSGASFEDPRVQNTLKAKDLRNPDFTTTPNDLHVKDEDGKNI